MRRTEPEAPPLRYKILWVDADVESRLLFEELLRGCTIVFAPTAFEARRLMSDTCFDGIVTEFWLPDFSGPAFCRELRKLDANVPVVFCTGSARARDRASGLRAGADAFVSKPVDPANFRAQLLALLDDSRLKSLSAIDSLERAIATELQRQMLIRSAMGKTSDRFSAAASERLAQRRAYEAFAAAGGTRACFANWWAQAFSLVREFQERGGRLHENT